MRDSGSGGEISVWEVYQYFYCPRKLYFIRKLGVYPPERKKMELGAGQHEREPRRTRRRTTIYGFPVEEVKQVLHDISLEDLELGLFGKADTVVELKDGEIIPVDVKYSDVEFVTRAWRKQMVAYALLLERALRKRVDRGMIFLLPSKRVLWVKLTAEDKSELSKDLERMRKVINSDALPPKVSQERCGYCEVAKFCKGS
jgi:CRISPR-associated exonuclease Cas4